jgi:signal transduction histidine kinase
MQVPEVRPDITLSEVAPSVLAARLRALYEISERLSGSLSREEIARIVTDKVVGVFGAAMGSLIEISPDGSEASIVGSVGFPEQVISDFQPFPVDGPFPLRDAVRTRSPVLLRDLDAWIERYPPGAMREHEGARAVLPLVIDDKVNGCITLTFDEPREFSPDDVDFMMSVAHHCALAMERTRLFEFHAQHVEALAKLHQISVDLSAAVTKEEVARAIDEYLRGTLGGVITGVMELSADGNYLDLLRSTNWSEAQLTGLQRIPIDAPLPVRDAVQMRTPIFLRNSAEWIERGYAEPPGGFSAGPSQARVALPLINGTRAIGVLTITYGAHQSFLAADREFLIAVAQQCAQALERARLYDAERSARLDAEQTARRIAQLQRSASALAITITRQEVAECILEQLREAFEPAAAAVLELSDDQTELHLIVAHGTNAESRARFETFSVDVAVPASEVVRTLQPSFIRSREEWLSAGYLPEGIADPERKSWATIPLIAENGPVGVMTITFNEHRSFPLEEREFMHGFADQCAIAIERARLYEAAESARGKAEQANAAKSQFLGIMSHELRTPLNAVIGYSDLLLMEVRGTLVPEQRIQVERIRSSAWHQLTLIEEILSYARIEAGKEQVRIARTNLRDLIADTVELLRPDAHRKNIALQVSVEAPDLLIETDPAKVRQIMLNLAGNAVKFTQQGSVEIGARRVPEGVVCWVRDTGPGIPADKLDLIWQPFTQVDQSDTRNVGGTGLGLTIARRLALLLGGTLMVQSELAKGTTFELRLPSATA